MTPREGPGPPRPGSRGADLLWVGLTPLAPRHVPSDLSCDPHDPHRVPSDLDYDPPQLSRRFVRAVPGPLSPRPRGHLGWMSFKPAEYPARASPPWVTFRMEAMRSRQAFPTGPGDSGDGCLRGDVPTACGPSLYAAVAKAEDGPTDPDLLGDERPPTAQNLLHTHGLWRLGPVAHRLLEAGPAPSLETQCRTGSLTATTSPDVGFLRECLAVDRTALGPLLQDQPPAGSCTVLSKNSESLQGLPEAG
uniref:Uncharacterized protein n=1 Tax=Rangifer tarandus platyrhynchus TaxID=3082113 RepID=A0ACB0DZR6_RANTA|nr:unnamed protein product [Rangifer tarandus platyrhynchus]